MPSTMCLCMNIIWILSHRPRRARKYYFECQPFELICIYPIWILPPVINGTLSKQCDLIKSLHQAYFITIILFHDCWREDGRWPSRSDHFTFPQWRCGLILLLLQRFWLPLHYPGVKYAILQCKWKRILSVQWGQNEPRGGRGGLHATAIFGENTRLPLELNP